MHTNVRGLLAALAAACALALAGCGGTSHPSTSSTVRLTPGPAGCPQAAAGHGSLGACSPKQQLRLLAPRTLVTGPTYEDLSNNDPCYCGAQIRAQGHVGLIVKANQGTKFIDSTAVGMIASARAAGLAVGVYDFDQNYTVAEAQVFVARARAAGIYPKTPNTFPLYLDVEYGSFSYTGLLAQIAYLRSQGYRVGIYTGEWYWGPHAGCRWPAGVTAWLSGYPNAPVPCGTTGYNAHQFTSTPIDMSVFLGSSAQFDAFVQKPPAGPTSAQKAAWARARDASYRVWDARDCTRHLTRADCGVFAHRVEYFQDRLGREHCFGKHAQKGRHLCQVVRPLVSHWSHARDADRARLTAARCRKPYRRRLCVVNGAQVARYERLIRQELF